MEYFKETARCPKCNCEKINAIYHKEGRLFSIASCIHEEHIHRLCTRCGYDWLEKPLDLMTAEGIIKMLKENEQKLDKALKVEIEHPNILKCKHGHTHNTIIEKENCEENKIGVRERRKAPSVWCMWCESYLPPNHENCKRGQT